MAGIRFSGLASGMDTESIVSELMKVQRLKVDKLFKKKEMISMKQDEWAEMNKKIYSFYTKEVFALKSSGTYKTRTASSNNDKTVGVEASASAVAGTHKVEVLQLAKAARLYSSEISDTSVKTSEEMEFTINDGTNGPVTIKVDKEASIQDVVNAINSSGTNVQATFDARNKRILLDNKVTGSDSRIQIGGVDQEHEQDFFAAIGLAVDTTTGELEDVNNRGQNSIYTYNGLTLEGTSNKVTVGGLTLTLKDITTSAVTISVTNDTETVYNKIKDFVKAYNELMSEINTKINAKASNYEPLTEEERASLDEETIKKWEDKIKSSIFRRDENLTSLGRMMRSIVTSNVGVDMSGLTKGFRYLSDLGIVTGSYTENGLLHIEGDEDFSLYMIKDNKLKAAIEENPDEVAKLLTAIGNELYKTMSNKMKSTSLNSAMTFYNDKEMKKQITDYERKIQDLEERLSTLEDRYYKQFSAMEKAIQKANNQGTYLTSLFSTGK